MKYALPKVLFYLLILLGFVSCSHRGLHADRRQPNSVKGNQNEAPVNSDESKVVSISVNASYSANSTWTPKEIQDRFNQTASFVRKSCPGIYIVLDELIRIEDPFLQDLDGSLTSESTIQMKSIRNRFKKAAQPTFFYVRRGKWPLANGSQENNEFTEEIGKAYILGGPRSLPDFESYPWNNSKINSESKTGWEMGSLDWSRLTELRSIHGSIVIGEGNSSNLESRRARNTAISVDRHELGHVLLNDGSHRETLKNMMSFADQNILDPDQCDLIRAYPRMESLRDQAIQKGMHQLCELYDKLGVSGKPTYCK